MTTLTDDTTSSRGLLEPATPLLARAPRAALWTFVATQALAFVLFVAFGRDQWFYWDEWELLAGREAFSLDSMLIPWHEHWVGGVVLLYRGLFHVFGLNSYLPYQLLGVAVHLTVAALLRMIMMRASVTPWIATVAAGSFALFGTGKQNVVWGFQITFTAALMFGLVHLLLAHHEGRFDWRDVVGIIAGIVALTFSGVGTIMILVVGLAVVVRRGATMAVVHVLPPAACFAGWWLAYGRHHPYVEDRSEPSLLTRYALEGFETTLHAIGRLPTTSWLLLVMLGAGLFMAWRHLGSAEVRRRAAEPASLLGGGLLFLGLVGWSRAWVMEAMAGGLNFEGRYVHIAAAMALPAVAVAADAVARRLRALGVIVLLPFLVGLPGNVHEIVDRDALEIRQQGDPDLFLAVAHSALIDRVPGTVQPFPENEQGVITVDWIRAGLEEGRIPAPDGKVATRLALAASLRLTFEQTDTPVVESPCVTTAASLTRRFEVGQAISFFREGFGQGIVAVQPAASETALPVTVTYGDIDGATLIAVEGPVDVVLKPRGPLTICG